MRPDRPSRTAQYMALFRALESALPTSQRLFDDPYARAFLTGRLRVAGRLARLPGGARLLARAIDRRWPGPRASAVARTRAIDDLLVAAIADGIDQLVILGAGYDTRPYRLARVPTTFEVDHPVTQAAKRAVLGAPPAHVRCVPVDFDRDDLAAAMASAGLEPGLRTFVVWEGVVAYLAWASVAATLRWAADVCAVGSELVFTYVHRGLLDGSATFPDAGPWVRAVQEAGEPFVLGLDPATLGDELRALGWRLEDDRSTTDVLHAYGRGADRVPAFYRVARAVRG
jgi:methyltransferase (TIGR00027 family)